MCGEWERCVHSDSDGISCLGFPVYLLFLFSGLPRFSVFSFSADFKLMTLSVEDGTTLN